MTPFFETNSEPGIHPVPPAALPGREAGSPRRAGTVVRGRFAGWFHAGQILGLVAAMNAGAWTGLVPNGSFESPTTEFADPRVEAWQKAPKPAWYDESGGYAWDQLAGVFLNTPEGSADHIANLERRQGAFLFAVPEVALVSGAEGEASAATIGTFAIGHAYRLTVGVLGAGGGMTNGVTLEVALVYRAGDGSLKTAAAVTVTNEAGLFPTRDRLTDFTVELPAVREGAEWVGRPIGVRVASTVRPELAGGYWDLDQVRVEDTIPVPNGSFERPSTVFADPRLEAWQKAPKPAWYDESGGFGWDQLAGVFLNTPVGSVDHLDNLDGVQGSFLFAVPEVAVFQDRDATAEHAFDVRFEPGRAYVLEAGVVGGGGGMTNGAALELALYYRDATGDPVTVAATQVTHTPETFPVRTRLSTVTLRTPPIRAQDPWAGRPLGVRLKSVVAPNLAGGYWDIDRVELKEEPVLALQAPRRSAGGIVVTVSGPPGGRVELRSAPTLEVLAGAGGTWVGTVTNTTGIVGVLDTGVTEGARFYQARELP